jgi:hypothetical protein
MGSKTETGFTIIEVMLFLAVSGMLAAAILVGAGVSINQQRYRDSVNSLKSYVQQQYSEVTNVTNDRVKSWSCNGVASVKETDSSGGEDRGTSDCVILGRFFTVDASGTRLSAANVVGVRKSGATDQPSDVSEIATNYAIGISPVIKDDDEVGWGAQIVKTKSTTPMPLSVLIVRSPLSGGILTFTADGDQTTNLGSMVTSADMVRRDLCVNAEVGTFVGNRMAVEISAFASNQGAIQIPPESESICD